MAFKKRLRWRLCVPNVFAVHQRASAPSITGVDFGRVFTMTSGLRSILAAFGIALASMTLAAAENSKPLEIYFIDVEGGQATLFVTPAGRSLLIDAGWPVERDSQRIAEAMKFARIQKLDFLLITHYHHDHVGGVQLLVQAVPVGTFIDHGLLRQPGKPMDEDYAAYQKILASGKYRRIVARPGDNLPIKGMDAVVVSSDGDLIDHALPGAGEPNSYCKSSEQRPADESENARSVGIPLVFGKLRILDLGDLTWDKEIQLMCPNNKLGKIDLYVVSHHGFEQSGSPALVDAIAPALPAWTTLQRKGGSPSAWTILSAAPGLQNLWQLHYSEEGGRDHNVAEPFIANIGSTDPGNYIKVAAYQDGRLTVFNSRTKSEKTYAAQ